MSDNDLIRRGDALEICTDYGFSRADECRHAIAAIPAMTAQEWQPIETAPKDGTEILTIRSNGHIAKGVFYDNPFGRKDTVIDNSSGKWWSVTHWMPLPSPPTGDA